jgi:hypothetical protein
MPILIQCTSCGRKLRVQDYLLGKMVKCPNCQSKIQAQALEEPTPANPAAAAPPQPTAAEDTLTPVVPPVDLDMPTPLVQILELPKQPASTPPAPSSEEPAVVAVAAPAPPPSTGPKAPAPPAPPAFPTPPLKVFGVLGAIVVAAAIVALGCSWAVAAAVQRAVESRKAP